MNNNQVKCPICNHYIKDTVKYCPLCGATNNVGESSKPLSPTNKSIETPTSKCAETSTPQNKYTVITKEQEKYSTKKETVYQPIQPIKKQQIEQTNTVQTTQMISPIEQKTPIQIEQPQSIQKENPLFEVQETLPDTNTEMPITNEPIYLHDEEAETMTEAEQNPESIIQDVISTTNTISQNIGNIEKKETRPSLDSNKKEATDEHDKYCPNNDHYYDDILPEVIAEIESKKKEIILKAVGVVMAICVLTYALLNYV